MKPSRTCKVVIGRQPAPKIRRGAKLRGLCGECYHGDYISVAYHKEIREYADTLLHEILHWYVPDAPEWWVRQVARTMTREVFR